MPTRRELLHRLACAAALGGIVGPGAAATPATPLLRRRLPSSGEQVAVIGLGTWRNFDLAADDPIYPRSAEVLSRFAAAGGQVVDSSPMYGRSSEAVGAMARAAGFADRLFYASKVWTRGSAAGRRQLDLELERFGRRPIDLMQVHNLSDVGTQLQVLRAAREAGELRLIGLSHYLSSAHAEVERLLRAEPVDVLQINLSIIEPEAEARLLPLAADRGVAIFANRVFAEGALFQRVRGQPLPGFAAELGVHSWAQYFIKWVLALPAVSVVLVGTGNPAHIVDNLAGGSGPLPDAALRRRMADHLRAL